MKIKNISVVFLLCIIPSYQICVYAEPAPSLNLLAENLADKNPSIISKNSLQQALMPSYNAAPSSSADHETLLRNFNQSLISFIKEHYNSLNYAEYLSQNSDEVVELLHLTATSNLSEDTIPYLCTIIKLFHEKMKQCELIDDSAVHHIIKTFPLLFEEFFTNHMTSFLDEIKRILEHRIMSLCSLPQLSTQPYLLTGHLPSALAEAYRDHHTAFRDHFEMMHKLRGMIVRFCEMLLSKTVWSRTSYEGLWNSALTIANDIKQLHSSGILDDEDDRDSLEWSLTTRFCYFLDLTGSILPPSLYREIDNDLSARIVPFLETQEQDECIKTKKEVITECLMRNETKARAFQQQGIVSDKIV